jgi:hypothetical protein
LALQYATNNTLKVIPAAGAHGSFVPIDQGSLYLDLRRFDCIDLNEEAGTVTFQGGVITRDLLRTLGERGFYASVPNSNAVGMAGFCLGGGSSVFNGLHGLAIDQILEISLVTADGTQRKVRPISYAEDLDLYHVLCGAGFGFGVITSITIRAWRISKLQMNENKIWTRRLIFPPSEISKAAELFTQYVNPESRLVAVLVFMRAPPTAPRPGAPMIMVNISYFGPAADAEKAAVATFDERFTSHAIIAKTGSQAIETMNNAYDPLNRHGDFKEQYSAWCSTVPSQTIVTAYERWIALGERTPEAKGGSVLVFAAKGTQALIEHDREGKKFFPRVLRDRSVFVQAVPWWTASTADEAARSWAVKTMSLVNAPQHRDAGRKGTSREDRVTAFAANLSKGLNINTIYLPQQIEQIKRLKGILDPENLFWNPVVDGV